MTEKETLALIETLKANNEDCSSRLPFLLNKLLI